MPHLFWLYISLEVHWLRFHACSFRWELKLSNYYVVPYLCLVFLYHLVTRLIVGYDSGFICLSELTNGRLTCLNDRRLRFSGQ